MSDSIQYIYQVFHLQHILPYNKNLHYHFRTFLVSLCESIHSQIIWNLILLILHYYFENSLLLDWFHTIYWSAVLFTYYFYLQSDSTLSFSKITRPPVQFHTLFDHLQYDPINFTLLFRKDLLVSTPHRRTKIILAHWRGTHELKKPKKTIRRSNNVVSVQKTRWFDLLICCNC